MASLLLVLVPDWLLVEPFCLPLHAPCFQWLVEVWSWVVGALQAAGASGIQVGVLQAGGPPRTRLELVQ